MFSWQWKVIFLMALALCAGGCTAPPPNDDQHVYPRGIDPAPILALEEQPGISRIKQPGRLLVQAESRYFDPLVIRLEERAETSGWIVHLAGAAEGEDGTWCRIPSNEPLEWSFWVTAQSADPPKSDVVGAFTLEKTLHRIYLSLLGPDWEPTSLRGEETNDGWEVRLGRKGQPLKDERASFFTFRGHIPLYVHFYADRGRLPSRDGKVFTPTKAALPKAPAQPPPDPEPPPDDGPTASGQPG